RDDPKSATQEGHMREAYYMAYDAANIEHVKLSSKEIDERLVKGPELVSAKFVIPYPPGFPIMVPGQIITKEIITFMRKLDVKEIHGYNAAKGLELLRPETLKHEHAACERFLLDDGLELEPATEGGLGPDDLEARRRRLVDIAVAVEAPGTVDAVEVPGRGDGPPHRIPLFREVAGALQLGGRAPDSVDGHPPRLHRVE